MRLMRQTYSKFRAHIISADAPLPTGQLERTKGCQASPATLQSRTPCPGACLHKQHLRTDLSISLPSIKLCWSRPPHTVNMGLSRTVPETQTVWSAGR